MVNVNITDFGKMAIIKALHNECPIKFVSMVFGNGTVPENYEGLTNLVNPLLECPIATMEKGANFVQLTSVFDNNEVDSDFLMTEVGVMAEDPVVGKCLFAYVNQQENPEPIYSASTNKLKESKISVQIIIDDTENVTAVVKSLTFASQQDFENHIHDYNNPHRVTKQQIGLGEVENYKTEDAPIKFKAAEKLENIKSGEIVSTLFGKIYTVIESVFSHFKDFNNPHKVTPLQIKAASEGHQHSMSDMTSGTLSVIRGGTGKSEWTKGLLLYASKDNEISQVDRPVNKPAVLMQNNDGAPYFKEFASMEFCGTSNTPPENKNIFWIDPTPITGGLKYFNGSDWVHVPVAYTK